MPEQDGFTGPDLAVTDPSRAAELIGLPVHAFDEARDQVLRSMDTLDIAACPGSGKTTLLVAKLAVLAEHWRERTRGICVLSHTNAARREIEARLDKTALGPRLLSYPHFVGTIHSFVNEFLALPWLRSLGYPIKMIDSDACESLRWRRLRRATRDRLQNYTHLSPGSVVLADARFALVRRDGSSLPFGPNTATYKELQEAARQVALEGYHCYDDMFLWAEDVIEKAPALVAALRDRFPVLFIDEAQDNSERQSAILEQIFMTGEHPVIRQRLGDDDQAIFDFLNAVGASTDPFPNDGVKKTLPNSYRFGQQIADIADPLGVVPYGLVGLGPPCPLELLPDGAQNTVFVFDDESLDQVLPAYAALLLETFSERELTHGTFAAVGYVHRPPDQQDASRRPQYVGDYWPEYDAASSPRNPAPGCFVQYLASGQDFAATTGESGEAVDRIAQGVLRAAELAVGGKALRRTRRPHRYLLRLLGDDRPALDRYLQLVLKYGVKGECLTEEAWTASVRADVVVGVSRLGHGRFRSFT